MKSYICFAVCYFVNLFFVKKLLVTGYLFSDEDFRVQPVWHTSKYPCEETFHDKKLDISVMLPISRKEKGMKDMLKGHQSTVFGELKSKFKSFHLRYYEYQLADESVSCDYWNYWPNHGFRGSNRWYSYNFDWMFYQLKYCAMKYNYVKPPSTGDTSTVKVMIIMHEGLPYYDKWWRRVLETDRLPYIVWGSEIYNMFQKYKFHTLYIISPKVYNPWLNFVQRLQIPSRGIIPASDKVGEILPREINRLICTQSDGPNNDFYLYHLTTIINKEYRNKHNFDAYPLRFLFMFPDLSPTYMEDISKGFQLYAGMPLIASVLTYRFPKSKIAFITFSAYNKDKPPCESRKEFKEYSHENVYELKALWSKTERSNEPDLLKKARALNECLPPLFDEENYDKQKVKNRIPIIVSFDYAEAFDGKGQNPLSWSEIAPLAWELGHRYSFMYSFVSNNAKIEYSNDEVRFNRNAYHMETLNVRHNYFTDVIDQVVEKTENHIEFFESSIIRPEEEFLKYTNTKQLRTLKNLNLLLFIPEFINSKLYSSLTYFMTHYNQQLGDLLAIVGSPKLNVSVVFTRYWADDYSSENTKCLISQNFDLKEKLINNPSSLVSEEKKEDQHAIPLFVSCGNKENLWGPYSENTYNMMLGFIQDDVSVHVPKNVKNDDYESVPSARTRLINYLFNRRRYPALIVDGSRMHHISRQLPVMYGKFSRYSGIAVEVARIIVETLKNEIL